MTRCTRPTRRRGDSMIDIEQLKVTDTLGSTRGNINAAYDEIMRHQPFIGHLRNPSVNLLNHGSLVGSVTASKVSSSLTAIVLPENNGCYPCCVMGQLKFTVGDGSQYKAIDFDRLDIDIPVVHTAVGGPLSGTTYTTFATPNDLQLPSPLACPKVVVIDENTGTVTSTEPYESPITIGVDVANTFNISVRLGAELCFPKNTVSQHVLIRF